MVSTMMSLSLCFSTKSLDKVVTQSAEPEFEIIIERNHPKWWKRRWSRKKKAGTEVWFGRSADDIPSQPLSELSNEVFASYSGPDRGLAIVPELEPVSVVENTDDKDANSNSASHEETTHPVESTTNGTDIMPVYISTDTMPGYIAGSQQWNIKSRKAYGISMSLYEQHPINGRISGDPIADSFGMCSRTNNSIMIVADGVNWGEKSKLAARCAIYGSMNYINRRLFSDDNPISSTSEAFQLLLSAVNQAHDTIIRYGGGQTTLCMALVLPIKDSHQFAVCIVNVGDSLAYVFSKYHGIREITTGSHDIQSERDIRDAGGAVGPVHGNDPELHNLTCSMTLVDPGDIVYLTTDGISDNFDPVVTKIAVASRRRHSDPQLQTLPEEGTSDANENGERSNDNVRCGTLDGKPEMEPHERHLYASKEMERIIHEFELFTEQPCSAQELCGALLQHVLKLTDPKRKVLENPDLYGKKLKSKDRKRRDSEIIAKLSKSPGKLDHATIIGYDVGVYHGNDDEDYEVMETSDEEMAEDPNPVSGVLSDDNMANNVPGVDSSPTKHDGLHDVFLDACDNHGNTQNHVLSPESQKKKNSLKNIKLKIKSRFKSPGRKSRSISDSTSPNPGRSTDHTPDPFSPGDSTASTQSSSSLSNQSKAHSSVSNQSKANRTLELKNAIMKEHERKHEEKRSRHEKIKNNKQSKHGRPSGPRDKENSPSHEQPNHGPGYVSPPLPALDNKRESVSPPAQKHSNRHLVHVSPPPASELQEHNKTRSMHVSPPPSRDPQPQSHDPQPQSHDRVRGRREMRLSPVQSPSSNIQSFFQPSTQTSHSRRSHPTNVSDTSSDSDIVVPSSGQISPDSKESWVLKPKLSETTPTGERVSERKSRRALHIDVQKAAQLSEENNQQKRQHAKSSRHLRQARRPKDLPNVKDTYSHTVPKDPTNQKQSDTESERDKSGNGITYVLPEVIPYGIDLADIMFIDDAGDSDVDGTQ